MKKYITLGLVSIFALTSFLDATAVPPREDSLEERTTTTSVPEGFTLENHQLFEGNNLFYFNTPPSPNAEQSIREITTSERSVILHFEGSAEEKIICAPTDAAPHVDRIPSAYKWSLSNIRFLKDLAYPVNSWVSRNIPFTTISLTSLACFTGHLSPETALFGALGTGAASYIIPPVARTLGITQFTLRSSMNPRIANAFGTIETILKEGQDGRTLVSKEDCVKSPFSAYGSIQMKFSDLTYVGSGTLVDDEHVLTAGHNLYALNSSGVREYAQEVLFFPGRFGSKFTWASEASEAFIFKPFTEATTTAQRKETDIALLKLTDRLGSNQEAGHLSIKATPSDISSREKARITGYPGDRGGATFMYTMEGRIMGVQTDRIAYSIDTYKGQSGSAVVRGSFCDAVHAYGYSPIDKWEVCKTYNSGTLINLEKLKFLEEHLTLQ